MSDRKKSENISKLPANKDGKTLRLCHLADVHLGYKRYNKITKNGVNQREVDVNIAFQESISRIISLKPDCTIIAGDLFHSVRPSNSVLTFCFRQLRRLALETGVPVVIVSGNHETPKRADTGSALQLLAEIEGVWVADSKVERFTFPELSLAITCLPHAALLDGPPEGLRADDKFQFNVLGIHAQVNEKWISEFGGVEIGLQALSPFEWDYIALGHVHIFRNIAPNAGYSGAIEHTAANMWGESKELKGFLEIELPNCKRTFHPLTSPREVVVLDHIDAFGLSPAEIMQRINNAVENVAGGIDSKIVKLEISNVPREAYRYLAHKEIRALKARALNFTLDMRPAQTAAQILSSTEQRRSLRDQLTTFCLESTIQNANREQVEKLLLTYLDRLEANSEAS